MLDALHGGRRLSRYSDLRPGLLGLPAFGERFDEGYQVGAVLVGQRDPGWHAGIGEPAHERVVNVLIRWQSTRRRRAAFERCRHEVARLDVQVRRVRVTARWEPVLAVSVTTETMAAPAIAKIKLFAGVRVAGDFADV